MKKYLIAGVLALVSNMFMTSCHDTMENYGSLEEAKKAQFAENFEKFYGKISPTQDWGFSDASIAAARAMTRGMGDNSCGTCIKPDMPNYPSANAPADITDAERAYVKNWFETRPGFTKGLNISNFYVQHVYGQASKPYKVWYEAYDQNYMNNHPGATSNYYRADYNNNGTIDYLSVGDGTNYTHLNDFNSNDAGTQWKTVYMENSSALSFKYHCSWSNEEFTYFKCAEIDVPGVGKGWYVGMCMYGEKDDNGKRKINKEQKDLEYADDWIVKVIPGNGSTISTDKVTKVYKKKTVMVHKWVFCEDLGSSASNKDYDYNDLVFDAKIIDECKVLRDADGNESAYTDDRNHSYYAEVTPLAAGGELMIKFNALSSNIHQMFTPTAGDNVLINTCRFDQDIPTPHIEALAGNTDKISFTSEYDANINNLVVIVRSSQVAYDLSSYKGEAPHKICVPVGTRWAYERTDIKDAYTGFSSYVSGGAEPWGTTGVEDNLYPLDGVAYDMKTDKTGSVSYEELSSSSTTTYSYSLADAANEHVWWSDVSGNTKFTSNWNVNIPISAENINAADIGNGTIIRFYFTCNESYMLKVTDNTWDDFDLGNAGWNINFMQGSAKNGYVEFKLNPTTANRFKQSGLIIYGTNVTALAITYDNSQKVTNETPSTPGKTTLVNGPLNGMTIFDAANFNNIHAGDEIRIYYTSLGQWYWQVQTWEGYNKGYSYTIEGWGGTSINTNNNFLNTTEKYITLPIDANLITMLQARGIRIQCDQIEVTEIALIRK